MNNNIKQPIYILQFLAASKNYSFDYNKFAP